jgi:hypothetical protein
LRTRHPEHPDPSATNQIDGACDVVEHQVDAAGDQVIERRRAAAVADGHHLGTGHPFEDFRRKVRTGADAGRAIVELSGIGLGISDQLGHRIDRQAILHQQKVWKACNARDRYEIARRIIAQPRIQKRVGRYVCRYDEKLCAVGRPFGDALVSDVSVRPGHILDDHRHTPRGGEAVSDDAAHDIARPARRVAHDDFHREPGGILGRARG